MTQEQNPESGTSSYVDDTNGTCGTYNGDVVKRTDAVGNVTCYQHDGLHRLTASLPQSLSPYYNQTPQKHYVYDQSAGNGSMGRLGHAYTCPSSSYPSGDPMLRVSRGLARPPTCPVATPRSGSAGGR